MWQLETRLQSRFAVLTPLFLVKEWGSFLVYGVGVF